MMRRRRPEQAIRWSWLCSNTRSSVASSFDLLRREHPRRSSLPFDSSYKFMRVTVDENGALVSYLKGAPEVILQRSRLSARRAPKLGRES